MQGSWTFATLVAATLVIAVTAEHCRLTTASRESQKCPIRDPKDDWIKLADNNDCEKYFRCIGGRKFPEQCPEGLHFQPSLGHCVPPKMAGCSHTFRVPHNKNCTKYYKIKNGMKILMKCDKGLYFSPAKKICMTPAKSGCKPSGPCDGEHESRIIPDRSDIAKYWLCERGRPISKYCPSGTYLNERHECETIKLTDNRSVKNFNRRVFSSEDRATADESDCGKYYVFRKGKAVSKECPPGLHFHRCLKLCVEPDIAGCDYTSLVPSDKNCAKFYKIKNNVKTEMTCQNGLYFSSTSNYCTIPLKSGCERMPKQCNDKPDGHIIPYKNHCSKYWECGNGNPIRRECPAGSYVNMNILECVRPEVTTCELPILLPLPDTCSSYYQFLRGDMSIIPCPKGQEFRTTDNTCVEPQESGCQHKRCDDYLKPSASECVGYSKCLNGSWTCDKCSEGLYYSPAQSKCGLKEDVVDFLFQNETYRIAVMALPKIMMQSFVG